MSDEKEYDLLGIGFGPANLSFAIAAHEDRRTSQLNIGFIESYPKFKWHPGMMVEGAKMQISFLKDMVTLRDPRSRFTFLNYLHDVGRLIDFTNLSTFLPSRVEYAEYMDWCAGHFSNQVHYGTRVEAIETIKGREGNADRLRVRASHGDQKVTFLARNLIIGIGGSPKLPPLYQVTSSKICHTSHYLEQKPIHLPNREGNYRIAVIGGGQSSAEVFLDLASSYPNANVDLVMRSSAFRPADDSPFVNEIFNPEFVSYVFNQETEERKAFIRENKATNYAVVRIELIDQIYSKLYQQRVTGNHRLRIHNSTDVESIESVTHAGHKDGGIVLKLAPHTASMTHLESNLGLSEPMTEKQVTEPYDFVMVATGYDHEQWKSLFMDKDIIQGPITRDYRIDAHAKSGAEPTIWLQGASEDSHGLSDTLLSLMSIRSQEIVESLIEYGYGLKDKIDTPDLTHSGSESSVETGPREPGEAHIRPVALSKK